VGILVLVVPVEQAVGDQPGQGVQDRRVRVAVGVADGLGGRQRAAAGEHSQPGQQPLLGRIQQVVAPVQGGPQRLLAGRQVTGPPGQQLQAVLQPCLEVLGR
jgi:hypothetical protein